MSQTFNLTNDKNGNVYNNKLKDYEYTAFLQFKNSHDQIQYKKYANQNFYGPVYWLLIVLFFAMFSTRVNVRFDLGPLYTISTILYVNGLTLFTIFIVGRRFEILSGRKLQENFRLTLNFIIERLFHDELENVITLTFSVAIITAFVSRIFMGVCSGNISRLEFLNCNPLAESNSPPIDGILLCFMTSLFMQLFFKNVRKSVLVLVWFMSTVTIIWSIIYLESWTQRWLIGSSMTFAVIQYEVERNQMSYFLVAKHASNEEKLKRIKLKKEHEEKEEILSQLNEAKLKAEKSRIDMQILEMTAKNEVKLKELETAQLRSLMGNVAHDLKTPIHSVKMDVDLLKGRYVDIAKQFPEVLSYAAKNPETNPMTIFESLEATCNFMTMSINRCLDYTKAASNIALKPVVETFDISSTLIIPVRCIKHHLQVADRERIVVHPLHEDLCPYVISDKHWFSENLLCFLSNAVKYSDKNTPVDVKIELVSEGNLTKFIVSDVDAAGSFSIGTGTGDCDTENSEASLERPGQSIPQNRQMIRVSVEDRGIGIPEDVRKNLFQPFKQAQRMAGGTGLGLYSLYKRMEALKGYCGIDSRTDGLTGSVFWLAFPYRPDFTFETCVFESQSLRSSRLSRVRAGSSDGSEKKECYQKDSAMITPRIESSKSLEKTPLRILLVDDSISILKITARFLRSKGHIVEEEENGSRALKRIKSAFLTQEFDLILTDLQMPVMDGFEFVRRFREYELKEMTTVGADILRIRKCSNRKGRLYIMGMSANSDNVSKQDALAVGMDQFITKPFEYQDFSQALEEIIHY